MIYIGGDKHGLEVIRQVSEFLNLNEIEFIDIGVKGENENIKLEILIPSVVKKVLENTDNKAIISCGTGVGVAVGANKFSGIRAVIATDEKIAEWSRAYDNCNILCLAGWNKEKENNFKIIKTWLETKYDGNQDRLKMLETFDSWH